MDYTMNVTMATKSLLGKRRILIVRVVYSQYAYP